MGSAFFRSNTNGLPLPGRNSVRVRRRTAGGLLACLVFGALGTPTQAAPKPKASAPDAGAVCQQAQARFDAGDLTGAARLLEGVPTRDASDRELADIANLRGAINLRRHRYDQARDQFAEAARRDPGLWAARFNAAEVSFRQGQYAAASKQFDDLRDDTRGLGKGPERRLAQYKHLLAELLAGREKPARDFLAEHQGDKTPPLEYHYLTAALERRHGHAKKADESLTRAATQYDPGAEDVYADSFRNLGWQTPETGRLVAVVNGQRDGLPETVTPSADSEVKPTPARRTASAGSRRTAEAADVATKPAFRTGAAVVPMFREEAPTARDVNGQMPPLVDARQPQTLVEDAAEARTGVEAPAVLGKPSSARRPKATPTPGASPDAADSASPAPPAATPAASASPAAASGQPGGTPAPAFVQKYEEAYVKYLEKDYPAAKALLDEADAIQPGQKSSTDLRDLIFKAYYESAYVSFRKGDFPTALEQLTNADGVKPNNPDALNLRGLVFSRQRNYEQAEAAFKKASTLDPTFYAAKFNYAELPFNYKNYTVARSRFEDLFSQTDPAKQPVEAEITQFKVFLTLLLEGKIDAARGFMEHFNFTGATPARYFCQAALDFYAGNMEKAQGWVDSAGKEYKPQLVSIFKESFYRIGWMIDVNGQPSLAGRPAAPTALEAPSATPTPAVASATATPAASPAAAAAVLALNNATPAASVPPVTAAPTPAASVAPTAAAPTPRPAASLAAAAAAPTPVKPPAATPVTTATPARSPVATPVPTATPAASVAAVSATASPAASASGATPAVAKATPTPEVASTPAAEIDNEESSQSERLLQVLLIGLPVIITATNLVLVLRALARRKERLLARQRAFVPADSQESPEPEEAQSPR